MEDVLHPFGELDVLEYYSKVATKLKRFLKGREIASRVFIPKFRPLINRGSKLPPLSAEELAKTDKKFLKLRKGNGLGEVKGELSKEQEKIWRYFPPRKFADLFYATNSEKGKRIDRIFYDLDRGKGTTFEDARKATLLILEEMKKDKLLKSKFKPKFFLVYTGSSFHIYLIFTKALDKKIYDEYFAYTKHDPLASLTGKWADAAKKKGAKVSGGHEKIAKNITLDPSQTPPGKLARAPFSLHMSDPNTIDGISIPITEKMLKDKNLEKKLKAYTPEKVLKDLDKLAKIFPR